MITAIDLQLFAGIKITSKCKGAKILHLNSLQ